MGDLWGKLLDEDLDREEVATKILAGAVVVSLVIIVLMSLFPAGSDSTTEFYVLGSESAASGYPENVTLDETVTIWVGVGNFEGRQETYTIVARTNDTSLVSRTITVNSEGRWEEPISFSFPSPGAKQLMLELYTGQSTRGEPYRTLRLPVTVRPS